MTYGVIYILVGSDGIRYVGQTRRTPEKRYRCHQHDAAMGRDLHVYRWWRNQTSPPRLYVIEHCPVERLNEREVAWIAAFKSAGVTLCNLTTGGDAGTTVSAETRAKLSASLRGRPSPTKGMTFGPETREKIGAVHRGRPKSAAQRAAISAGLRSSEKARAHRARTSAAQVGRKRSPEARARMASAQAKRYARMTDVEKKALTSAANTAWRARAA